MSQSLNTAPDTARAPSLLAFLAEARVLQDFHKGWRLGPALPTDYIGDGSPIMVLPGFMTSDRSTVMLRRTLNAANYRAYGWGLGRNYGIKADIFDRMDRQLDILAQDGAAPVTLIGWSLGGVIAREYAKYAPERIARVITLGSPFSGNPRANHAWRLYELINRYPVDRPPLDVILSEKPPVPTFALWSPKDGIVAPITSQGLAHESDRAIEVDCGHLGFTTSRSSLMAILAILDGALE